MLLTAWITQTMVQGLTALTVTGTVKMLVVEGSRSASLNIQLCNHAMTNTAVQS